MMKRSEVLVNKSPAIGDTRRREKPPEMAVGEQIVTRRDDVY